MKQLMLAILLVGIASAASAEVKLILFPRCEGTGGSLPVSSIAWADGDEEEAAKVRAVRIDEKYYKDGYIDRTKLTAVLKRAGFAQVSIVGSSIRVTKPDRAKIDLEELAEQSVKRGDAVKVLVKGKGISVETHGTVSADALPGDEVQVELSRKKSIKGTLCNEHCVEVRL
jgi:hypothetical protein